MIRPTSRTEDLETADDYTTTLGSQTHPSIAEGMFEVHPFTGEVYAKDGMDRALPRGLNEIDLVDDALEVMATGR